MSDAKHITDDCIIQTLESSGCSWRDFILVGSPPGVYRFVFGSGLLALLIEDDSLAEATIEFLYQHRARTFGSFEDVKRELGWDGLFRFRESNDDVV